jgi:hypothetical protein
MPAQAGIHGLIKNNRKCSACQHRLCANQKMNVFSLFPQSYGFLTTYP